MQAADPITSIREFCQPSKGFFLFKWPQKGTAVEQVVERCFQSLSLMPLSKKWEFIQGTRNEFKTGDAKKVEVLKRAFCEKGGRLGWKGALLGASAEKVLEAHFVDLDYSNSMDCPIKLEQRTKFYLASPFEGAFGSTFATNKANRIGEKDHILDAIYGCVCPDGGVALAISDGSGGHFGDAAQDKMIGRAAHTATKSSVRFFSAHHSADDLVASIDQILVSLKQEILLKAKGESATLACCRAFPVDGGFRIVGFNIGDNMAIAWDPTASRPIHLLPSRCSEAGTALLPESYRSFEVEKIDTFLPYGCHLLLMTDGVHDTLAHLEEEKAYPNQLKYKVRTLNASIFEDLPVDTSSQQLLQTLLRKSFEGAERLRHEQREPDIQIGDDFSLIQCQLSLYTTK